MADKESHGRRLPRWLVIASYPIATVLLTLFFIYLGFPYDLLVARYLPDLESASSMQMRVGEVGPQLSLFGPGVAVRDIRAAPQDGEPVQLDKVFVRPAWSLSWITGAPALYVDVKSAVGKGAGTVTVGSEGGFSGALAGFNMRALPLDSMLSSVNLLGILDADIDLHRRAEGEGGGLIGHVKFDLLDGTIGAKALPMPVPFESLGGDLRFGEEDTFVLVEGVKLEGKLLAAQVDGKIGPSRIPGRQPLDLAVRYEIRNQTIAAMFGGARGESQIKISGTLQQPVVR